MTLTPGPAASSERGDLGGLLRAHRRRLVLSQAELAHLSGVSTRAISDLERGANRSARLSTIRRLATALRLSDVETQRMLQLAQPAARPSTPSPSIALPGASGTRAPGSGESGSRSSGPGSSGAVPGRRLVRDAELSSTAGSWERSLSFYEAAVAEVDASAHPDLRDLCDALLGFGRTATMGLRRHDARPALVRAARLAFQLRDRDRLVEAAAWYSFMTKAGVPGLDAADVWHNGLLVVADDDLAGRAVLTAARATAAVLDHLPHSAPALAERALDLARRSGDGDALAVAISTYVLATWGHPEPAVRLALGEELASRVEAPAFPHAALAGVEIQAVPALQLGDVATFERCTDVLAAGADAAHHPFALAQAAMWRGARALLAGDRVGAEAASHESVALAGRAPNFTAAHVAQIFAIRRSERREGDLLPMLGAGVAAQPTELAWRAALALSAVAAGDRDRADSVLERVGTELWPPAVTWTLPVTLAYLAEASWALDRPGLAAQVGGALEPYREEVTVLGTGSACQGAVTHYLGLAALAVGDRSAAIVDLRDALARHEALDAPLLVERTEAVLRSA